MGKTFSTGLLTNGIWQDSSNNIGIGAAPSGSYKFEVTGTGRFTGALSGTSATFSSTTVSSTTANGALVVAGGVGIGGEVNIGGTTIFGTSATPNSKFYIYGGFSAGLNLLQNYSGSAYTTEEHRASDYSFKIGTTASLTIASTGAATFSSSVTINQSGYTFGAGLNLLNWQFVQGGDNALYLAYSGTQKFTIASTGAATFSSSVTSNGYFALTTTSDAYATQGTLSWNSARGTVISGKTASVFDFAIYGAASQALITNPTGTSNISFPSGNVGIGTTSPDQKLTIQAAGTANGLVSFKSAAGTTTSFIGVPNANGDVVSTSTPADICLRNETGNILFATNGNTERMRITSGGSVGIGKTGTIVGLDVYYSNTDCINSRTDAAAGNARSIYTGWYSASPTSQGQLAFNVTSNGNVTNLNNSYGSLSDIKLKENIVDASPKLDDLLKVRIVNYNLIGQESKQIGVIAQELEQVFPLMIEEYFDKDENGNNLETITKGVKYSVFVPMLIKAIQEQQAQIEELKQIVATINK